MTLEEMRDEVLATVASFDGRAVDRRVIEDWHAVAGTADPRAARAAVQYWYATNRGYMQPHDLAVSIAAVTGSDRPETLTARRLDGLPPKHEITDTGLAPMMELERKAER